MKKLAIAMLAAGALATSFAPAASAAAPDPITDSGCGFTSVTDPNPEAPDETQTGYLHGGPIAQNGTLTCTIKVGVDNHAGAYVNGASASATGTSGATILPPTIISYVSPSRVPVYACDKFVDAGGTAYYWDGDLNVWTTNSGVKCELAISGGTDDPALDPVNDLVELLDTVICIPLAALHAVLNDPAAPVYVAADGDVYLLGDLFWDCPPYEL